MFTTTPVLADEIVRLTSGNSTDIIVADASVIEPAPTLTAGEQRRTASTRTKRGFNERPIFQFPIVTCTLRRVTTTVDLTMMSRTPHERSYLVSKKVDAQATPSDAPLVNYTVYGAKR
jgi:hypothetical protein